MGLADLVAPIASADWDDRELGQNDGPPDGRGYFLGAFDAKTNMAIEVANGNKGLEAGALPGTGLLLHGHNLENLVL